MRTYTAACAALVLAWVMGAGVARADAADAGADMTASAADAREAARAPVAKEPPALATTTPAEPPIATPSPEASPQKVEDAKSTAKAAELHPIVPSPRNPLHPAFQLYSEIDLPILGIGTVFAAARLVRMQKAYCAPLCDRVELNRLDRNTAGYWSPAWQGASSVVLVAIGAGALTMLYLEEGFWPGLNDAAVIAESALAGIAVVSMMTLAAGRPRPFLYGETAPLSTRNGADAGLSFLSSHSVAAFAIATSSFVAMSRLRPGSKAAWVVLVIGSSLATFVATARVFGGMHFITDSVGGAIVGSSAGLLIPSLHGSPVAIVPVAAAGGQRGLALSLRF
jgi:membrane-associated phospholipid phosphatase